MTFCNLFTQLNSNFFNCYDASEQNFSVNNSVFGNGFMNDFMTPTISPKSSFGPWFNPASFVQPFQSFDISNMFSNFNFNDANVGNFGFSNAFNFTFNPTASNSNSSKGTENTENSDNANHAYLTLNKTDAAQKASTDSSLECLTNGGTGWKIAPESFRTDIPYAKKGTGAILSKVSSTLGINITVTSALGTGEAGNPHSKSGDCSHHNANNPKLDFRIPSGYTANSFAEKLRQTGYFSHVLAEGDHVDVQIDISKYSAV